MQKYLLLSLLAAILGLLPLNAQDFTQGDFTFTVLDPEAKTVAVTGCTLPENSDVTIPATATLNNTEYTVTTIQDYVNFPRIISSLHLSANIANIIDGFFYFNPIYDELSVDPENKNFTIYEGALYSKDMTRLYSIPRNNTTLTVPEGVTSIEYGACSNSKLTSATLPETIQRIEQLAFAYSRGLSQTNLPSALEFIGRYAFASCGLTSVTIPANAELYDATPFQSCPMTDIVVDPQNANYNSFNGCLYSKDYSTLLFCPSLKDSVVFHVSVKTLGAMAFDSCVMLRSITIPSSVQTLGDGVFRWSGLEEITIPESITTIPRDAIQQCDNLKKINFPETLEEIGYFAVSGCPSLETVIIPGNVSKIAASAFINCGNAHIFIQNSDTEITDDLDPQTFTSPQPTYYADGSTRIRLESFVQAKYPGTQINRFPHLLVGSPFFIGASSALTTSVTNNIYPAQGFQADFTLPEGLSLSNFECSGLTHDFVRLDNGDYRLICYTSDGTTPGDFDTTFTFISDANLQRSRMLIHNVILSVSDRELRLDDTEVYVSGYEISFKGIPEEIEEYDSISLPNPLSVQYEDISYRWEVHSGNAKITDNNTLHALSPGPMDLAIIIFDPMIESYCISTSFTITPALWGDSNASGSIELADVVTTVNHILERNPEPFNAKLADVDRNGRINIVDVTSTVKLVLKQPVPDTPESDIQGAPAARELAFSDISRLENGKNILSLNLKPDTDYTALQTDLEVPADVSIEAISLGEGLSHHTIDYATVAPGVTRVILYSSSLAELAAVTEQPVLNITLGELPANGSIRTLRTLACDAQGQSFTLGNAEKEFYTTTGITTTATASYNVRAIAGGIEISGAEGAAITVSDLQGRTVATALGATTATRLNLAPGIYLVSATGQHPAKVLVK